MSKIKTYNNDSIISDTSDKEDIENTKLLNLYKTNPIPNEQQLNSLGLFISRQVFSRMMFFHKIYTEYIVDSFGSIMEFGCRWGQNMALLQNLRGMYEPYNYTRKIIGFDTFEGFIEVDKNDGDNEVMKKGSYNTVKNYYDYLDKILKYHETQSPLEHKQKYEIIKGDASLTLKGYLSRYPETIVSFVFFDMDLYKPTKACLELLLPHLHKGSVLAFDELNHNAFPGETMAFREVFGNNYKLYHDKNNPMPSWIIL